MLRSWRAPRRCRRRGRQSGSERPNTEIETALEFKGAESLASPALRAVGTTAPLQKVAPTFGATSSPTYRGETESGLPRTPLPALRFRLAEQSGKFRVECGTAEILGDDATVTIE